MVQGIPCDGIIAVNDKAATTPVLAQSFKASTDKKVFVWTKEHFKEVQDKVLNSDKKYFLITKNPVDMKEILVDMDFKPGIKKLIIGPCNDRPGAVKLGQNQSITQEEADALEAISKKATTSSSLWSKSPRSANGPNSGLNSVTEPDIDKQQSYCRKQ